LFANHNWNVLDDPRVELSFNDARSDLQFAARTYDVIVSEPSNPWMTVAANLFTEEFFEMASTRLRPGGVFSQWVQNYYLPREDLQSIIGAFRKSFRYVLVFETSGGTDVLLMGSQEPISLDPERLQRRMSAPAVLADLDRIGVRDASAILQFLRVGPAGVDRLVRGAPRNTDNNARVEFSAPRSFGRDTLERNSAFLHRFGAEPPDGPRPGDRK
jgi:spermidine synthase